MNVRELRGKPRWWPLVVEQLALSKVVRIEDLAEVAGVDPEKVERVLWTSPLVEELGDGWTLLEHFCDGAVFTTRLTGGAELVAGDDLCLWARLAAEGFPLASGGEVRTVWGDEAVLHGPKGWLDGFQQDDVLAFRLKDGALQVTAVKPASTNTRDVLDLVAFLYQEATEAAGVFATRVGKGWDVLQGALIEDALLVLMETKPRLFRKPLPPLTELLEDAVLVVRDGRVALPGAPWDVHEVDGWTAEDIMRLTMVRSSLITLDEGSELKDLVRHLGDSLAVQEVIADEVESYPLEPDYLDALSASATTQQQRVAVSWLAARTAEAEGRADDAASLTEKALPQAAIDAAEYAAAKGEYLRADQLLKDAGRPSDDWLRHQLRPLLSAPSSDVPRNQPCPCGSGRKYKSCCQGKLTHPLSTRAKLMYCLLLIYAARAKNDPDVADVLALSAPETHVAFTELAMFERGVVDRFLQERGHWLREDERALLEAWTASALKIYEVVSARPGSDVTVRPLPDGDPVILHDRTMSRGVRPLDLMLARLLPNGEGGVSLFCDPVAVPRMVRAHLLPVVNADPVDALAVASFFVPRSPVITNTEGQELLLCSARYEAPDGSWTNLSDHLEEDGPDRFLLKKEDGIIQGSVRREGPRWTLETNSLERLRILQDILARAVPQARQIDESTVPLESLPEQPPAPVPAPSGADLEQFMLDWMIQQEHKWIEEPVPALGGLTPRQVVAQGGPVLAELNALLDDFEWASHKPSDMSGRRIRALLGL